MVVVCAANPFPSRAQFAAPTPAPRNSASARGKQTFVSTCAQCHGLDGKGSERGPNISDRASVQRLSDSQLFRVIENGVPGTGMPPFGSLQKSQIRELVAYLRILQGANKTAALPGDPGRGKSVFFGPAGCSECHMVAGDGGFFASDLSDYARIHNVEQIRSAITGPKSGFPQARLVTATLRNGEKIVGRLRNEDNFSIQLQTAGGQFYFLSKSEVAGLESSSQSLMPSDYGSRLDSQQLNDIISYLMSVAGANESTASKNESEWD